MNGKYVPSLLAAIGDIIEQHFVHIGFAEMGAESGKSLVESKGSDTGITAGEARLFCPRCGSPDMVFQEGCRVCRNCGFSTCG